MVCSEDQIYFPLPVLDNRFTSNELDELLSFFKPELNAPDVDEPREPLPSSHSGSDNSPNPDPEEMDERKKKKRKISNRESARRSRLRKKRYVENLTAQANRLKVQNREYVNRLTLALNQLHAVKRQNQMFRFESVRLIQTHAELNRVLQIMRFPEHKNNLVTDNLNMDGSWMEMDCYSFDRFQRYAY